MTITSILSAAFVAAATAGSLALQFSDSVSEVALLALWGGGLLMLARRVKQGPASTRLDVGVATPNLSLAETR